MIAPSRAARDVGEPWRPPDEPYLVVGANCGPEAVNATGRRATHQPASAPKNNPTCGYRRQKSSFAIKLLHLFPVTDCSSLSRSPTSPTAVASYIDRMQAKDPDSADLCFSLTDAGAPGLSRYPDLEGM